MFNSLFNDIYIYMVDNHYFTIISRILVAVIIGGIIGFEREQKNRPAGFRTHVLVSVSACSLMILSDILFTHYYTVYGIALDPQRIGAQVVSGIGFLGAGTIIHFGNSVRGLTTAASIWAVAALGLIVGCGYFFLAVFTVIIIELTLICFDRFSNSRVFKLKKTELFLTIKHSPEVIGNITMLCAQNDVEILELDFKSFDEHVEQQDEQNISKIKLVVNIHKSHYDIIELVTNLKMLCGIVSVQV